MSAMNNIKIPGGNCLCVVLKVCLTYRLYNTMNSVLLYYYAAFIVAKSMKVESCARMNITSCARQRAEGVLYCQVTCCVTFANSNMCTLQWAAGDVSGRVCILC